MRDPIQIDIIILSYAQNDELKQITTNCINSLFNSENPELIKFNAVVVESEKSIQPYQYRNATTVYPSCSFGYHKYMNLGIRMTKSPFVCMCNNDLIFHKNWATEILKPFAEYSDVWSASPICPVNHIIEGYKINDGLKLGYLVRREVAGWCIFVKRDIFKRIGMLDENYIFWCADNDYTNTLKALKINHVLVTSSIVTHLENKTLDNQTEARQDELTDTQLIYFYKKWKVKYGVGWLPSP